MLISVETEICMIQLNTIRPTELDTSMGLSKTSSFKMFISTATEQTLSTFIQ